MHVFVNGRFLQQPVTGVQRYSYETLLALDQLLESPANRFAEWELLAPMGTAMPCLKSIRTIRVGPGSGHFWEQLVLPWYTRKGLLLSFGFTGPLAKRCQIITIHDAAVVRVPAAYSRAFRTWYRIIVRGVGQRAFRVMCVSDFAADEAVECFGVPHDRIRLSTEGWQHFRRTLADFGVLARHGLADRPFLLAVGSHSKGKNLAALALALDVLGPAAPPCVVVGSAFQGIFRDAQVPAQVIPLGPISDAELKALYMHASCLVMPSFYEGFGIPPLEAMAHGCPVVASTAKALREVCGDAALYFDPHNPSELAGQLRLVLSDAALRSRLSAAGRTRAAMYSWRESALRYLGAVHEAVSA
jgi:glycosyltransferase involved in cell wall biosynthesis